jgi:prevent-host-death family protein
MDVASRDLRNNTRQVLDRVQAGESVTITVDGRPVAELRPAGRRPRWMRRDEFVRDVIGEQADPGMADDLRSLTGGETTDDLPGT